MFVLGTAHALSYQATLYTVMGGTASFFGRGRCFCAGDVDTVSSIAFYWISKMILFSWFQCIGYGAELSWMDAALPLLGNAVCLITVLW